MNKNSIRYRDTVAAPGSDLFKALTEGPENGRKARAETIYQQCEDDNRKTLDRYRTRPKALQSIAK